MRTFLFHGRKSWKKSWKFSSTACVPLSSLSCPWLESWARCCTTPLVCVSVSPNEGVASGAQHGTWGLHRSRWALATHCSLALGRTFPVPGVRAWPGRALTFQRKARFRTGGRDGHGRGLRRSQEGFVHLPAKLHLKGHFKQPLSSAAQRWHIYTGNRVLRLCCGYMWISSLLLRSFMGRESVLRLVNHWTNVILPSFRETCRSSLRGSIGRGHEQQRCVSPASAGHRQHGEGACVLSIEDRLERRPLTSNLAVGSVRDL